MDGKENVLFNNQSAPQEGADIPSQVPTAVNQQVDSGVVQQGGEAQPVDASVAQPAADAGVTDGVASADAPPPPTGIGGNSKLIKIIIGIVLLLIVGVLIFLFIPKQQQAKNVKLVWWGLWEDDRVVQQLIADFEKENPTITVEYVKQDQKGYRDRLVTRMKNGDGPDIFRYHNTWLPMMQKLLEPLSQDVITPEEFQKVYYPVMQEDLVNNGGIYGIPLGADTLALFVNKDLLQAAGADPPQDWNNFAKIAATQLTLNDKDTKKITQAGAAMGTYGNVQHASDIVSMILLQQGVKASNSVGADGKSLSAGAAFVASPSDRKQGALEFYNDFAKGSGKYVKSPVWDSLQDDSLLAFSKGNLAMMFGYSWDVFEIEKLNKNLVQNSLAVYQVPRVPGGKNKTIASYWVDGVSAASLNKKEAMTFMHYLAQKETAQKFYTESSKTREFGEPPARKDLATMVKDNKLVYPFVSQLNDASSSFFSSDTNDGDNGINTLTSTYLTNAGTKLANEGSSSIEEILKVLNDGVTQVFDQYAKQ